MKRENVSVRETAKKLKIPMWKVALRIGISEPTMVRWLRTPLSPDKEKVIMEAIEELAREVC